MPERHSATRPEDRAAAKMAQAIVEGMQELFGDRLAPQQGGGAPEQLSLSGIEGPSPLDASQPSDPPLELPVAPGPLGGTVDATLAPDPTLADALELPGGSAPSVQASSASLPAPEPLDTLSLPASPPASSLEAVNEPPLPVAAQDNEEPLSLPPMLGDSEIESLALPEATTVGSSIAGEGMVQPAEPIDVLSVPSAPDFGGVSAPPFQAVPETPEQLDLPLSHGPWVGDGKGGVVASEPTQHVEVPASLPMPDRPLPHQEAPPFAPQPQMPDVLPLPPAFQAQMGAHGYSMEDIQGLQDFRAETDFRTRAGQDVQIDLMKSARQQHEWNQQQLAAQHHLSRQMVADAGRDFQEIEGIRSAYHRSRTSLTDANVF